MAHNRKLVLSGSSLTMARIGRLKVHEIAPKVMDELEQLMIFSKYFDEAPFGWVGLTLRFGLKNDEYPVFQGIDKSDGELALAIELDTHELLAASREELQQIFTIATLKSLIHAGKKYDLPIQALEDRLEKLMVASQPDHQ